MKEVLLKTAFVFIQVFATISLANGSNDGKSKEPATGSSLWEISGNGLRHNSTFEKSGLSIKAATVVLSLFGSESGNIKGDLSNKN